MAITIAVLGSYNDADIKRAHADLGRLGAAAKTAGGKASSGMQGFSDALTRTGGKMQSAGERMTMTVSAPLLAIGAYAVKTEAQFGTAMSQVQVAAGVPAAQMKSLSDLAMKMGAETVFSAGEAADAMLELAKGGLSAAEIQSGALKSTMALAAAEGMGLADAATVTSNAMAMFGLKAEDTAKIADALAGGSMASTASVSSLAQALQQVGGVANDAGLSINDTVGVLAAFDKAGLKGSDAGTSLKTMLARLVPQTDAAKAAMADLGLKFTDSHGNFLSIEKISGQLQKSMVGLSDAERTTAMNTIFGSDAKRAALVLSKQGEEGIRGYIDATEKSGAAQKMADARMSGTAGALEKMKGSVETAALTIGQQLAPYVVQVAGKIEKLANQFSGLDGDTKALIIKIAGLAIAFGPGLKVLGMFTSGVGRTVGAVRTTGSAIATMSRVSTAGFKGTVGGLQNFYSGLRSGPAAASAFTGKMGTLGGAVRTVGGAFKTAGAAAVTAGKAIGGAILGAAKAVGQAMLAIGRAMMANPWMLAIAALIVVVVLIVTHWDTVKEYLAAVWEWIKKTAMAVWDGITAYFRNILGIYKAVFTAVWGAITGFLTRVWNGLVKVATAVFDGIKAYFTTMFNIYKTIFTTAWNIIARVVTGVWTGIKTAVSSALGWISDKFTGLVTFVSSLPGKITGAAKGMFDGLLAIARGAINFLIDAWNRLDFGISVTVPDWVPGVGGKGFSVQDIFPDIPRLKSGAIIQHGGDGILANIGEGRYDEAVVPLTPSVRRNGLGGSGMTVAAGAIVVSVDARGASTSDAAAIDRAVRAGVASAFDEFLRRFNAS